MTDEAKLTHELGIKSESKKILTSGMKLEHTTIIRHFRKGELIDEVEIPSVSIDDLVVSRGRLHSAKLLLAGTIAGGTAGFRWVAIGTSAAVPAVGNTALGGEITTGGGGRARGTATTAAGTAQLVHKFNFTAHFGSVQESGVFSKASAGTMVVRGTFGAKSVDSGDSLEVTHRVRLT